MTILRSWRHTRYTPLLYLPWRHRWRFLLFSGLAIMLVLVLLIAYVRISTRTQRFTDIASVPPERVGIVFGAGVRADGRLTRMLAERVMAATDLYKAGRVDKLLMTGDNSRVDYDEVTAMRRYAIEQGVAADDIALDYAGFSTYESCYRAHAVFGVERAVLVTQQFHLPRAVYTCNQLGVRAVGLGTPDWGQYRESLLVTYMIRESLATLKALWQVHITQPLPTFLGPAETID